MQMELLVFALTVVWQNSCESHTQPQEQTQSTSLCSRWSCLALAIIALLLRDHFMIMVGWRPCGGFYQVWPKVPAPPNKGGVDLWPWKSATQQCICCVTYNPWGGHGEPERSRSEM